MTSDNTKIAASLQITSKAAITPLVLVTIAQHADWVQWRDSSVSFENDPSRLRSVNRAASAMVPFFRNRRPLLDLPRNTHQHRDLYLIKDDEDLFIQFIIQVQQLTILNSSKSDCNRNDWESATHVPESDVNSEAIKEPPSIMPSGCHDLIL